jgi:5-methyltetrahydrofolate--homocysteine methyltransferase
MNLIEQVAHCIEFGKINKASPYPPELKGQDGADELTQMALENGFAADEILQKGFVEAMNRVGQKFSEHKIFVPQMLMSAKAMNTAMKHLRPYFQSGEISRKGKFIIGTVAGDLHDIGKNLVAMMVEGAGWEVIDLGVDINHDRFLEELEKHPGSFVGLSAMLTTTMVNMESIVKNLKEKYPDLVVCIGGAPVNQEFCQKINADFYSPDPQGLVNYLGQHSSKVN